MIWGLLQPPNRTARSESEAITRAEEIGYPLVVRPSYVLGGRAMEIVHEQRDLERYMREAVKVSMTLPVLLDRFLNDAIECDVDAICDGQDVYVAGVMEHIEQAGVHSGDSACSLPPYSLSAATIAELERQTVAMARGLSVVGLMNVQFAIQQDGEEDRIFVLEVNRALRAPCPSCRRQQVCNWPKSPHAAWWDRLYGSRRSRPSHPRLLQRQRGGLSFVKFPAWIRSLAGNEVGR